MVVSNFNAREELERITFFLGCCTSGFVPGNRYYMHDASATMVMRKKENDQLMAMCSYHLIACAGRLEDSPVVYINHRIMIGFEDNERKLTKSLACAFLCERRIVYGFYLSSRL